AFGVNALYYIQGTAANNTALGENALQYLSTGAANTAVGVGAMQGIVGVPLTGSNNVALGKDALLNAQGAAASNVAIGMSALKANTTQSGSVAIGFEALMTTATALGNTAVGYQALKLSQTLGIDNTAIGYQALQRNTTGDYNNAFGRAALEWNTTGSANLAIGSSALGGNDTGNNNVAVGVDALGAVNAGNNTAVGYQAGYAGTALTTGTNNTFIGYQAQANANNYTNGTALGNGAVLTASNRIVLGNTAIASIYAQVTSITAISDRRHKKDIEDLGLGLDFIRKLQPVSYRFNNGDETLRYGFIAQDVEKALSPELQALVEKADDKDSLALLQKENNAEGTYRVNYGELTSPIVKAIQEQQIIIDTQRARIDDQEARIEKLSKDIETKMTSFEKDLNGLKAHTGYGINKAQIGLGVLVGMGAGMALIFFFGPVLLNRQRKAE
ncbi:MAG: tail fiber domain-containing protein, partial [Micavibrio aeruginosavorus]|nr:tail fiber domain-containing protein [Micavibrio aeruginosavorus]